MRITRTHAMAQVAILLIAGTVAAVADIPADLAKARATDPVALGWMVGSPPPPDKMIRFEDGSFYQFPQWRWTFSHWRELRPTIAVARGSGPTQPLMRTARSDLDAVTFVPIGGTAPMKLGRLPCRQLHRRHRRPASRPHRLRALLRRADGRSSAHRLLRHQIVLRDAGRACLSRREPSTRPRR